MSEKRLLGQILVDKGIVTVLTIERVVAIAKRQNRKFGWVLEDLGLVTAEEMADALACQYNMKMVSNLTTYSYPPELLKIMTPDFAMEQLLFPLKLEANKIAVAIADLNDMKLEIASNFAENNALELVPCVTSRREIYAAINKYYLGGKVSDPTHKTVLVVDDEPFMQTVLKDMLVKHGYKVVIANDGMEGFKKVISEKPHVIIADKVMPKLDGFAMLEAIQALPDISAVPVILISDKMKDEDEAQVFTRGFFDYIYKPIREVSFIARVKHAFDYYEQRYGIEGLTSA